MAVEDLLQPLTSSLVEAKTIKYVPSQHALKLSLVQWNSVFLFLFIFTLLQNYLSLLLMRTGLKR